MPIAAPPFDTVRLADLPELSDLLLRMGKVRLRIISRSMAPTLRPGDEIAVEPFPIEALRTGDLILFKHDGRLICHRLIGGSQRTLLTRGDATSSAGERIGLDQVLGKVVGIRKRTVWAGFKASVQTALVPSLLSWLPRLQDLKAYRLLMRACVAPFLSYHLGIAQGAHWHQWQGLVTPGRLPRLQPAARPQLLVAKRGTDVAGQAYLVFKHAAWHCENVSVRIRYRGVGIESALTRWAHLLFKAQTQPDA